MAKTLDRLLTLNDPRMAPYLAATDEASRTAALVEILAELQARVRTIVGAYARAGVPISEEDAEEIVGTVTLRLLRKIRAAAVLEEESIQSLEAYATTLARNATRDSLRSRWPERARLKQRLRYLFTHDPRLALWMRERVTLCGLALWRERWSEREDPAADAAAVCLAIHRVANGNLATAADALALFLALARPARLVDLVACLAPADPIHPDAEPPAEAVPPPDSVEARQYLSVLWQEIRGLPARQRTALLLNLREPSGGNATALFLMLGIATLDDLAAALDMTPAVLRSIWEDLPLDDLRIAAHLNITRQQVINLRKSARERLARRMGNG
jgi:RNA polymerase sigma factor (sigma-70 family)